MMIDNCSGDMKMKPTLKIEYLDNYDTDWYKIASKPTDNACFDLRACFKEPYVMLMPGERMLIPLGIKTSFPADYELQIRARSGLALKKGLSLVNGIGTIDSSYRGELGAIVINLGNEPVVIQRGDRIVQAMLHKLDDYEIEIVDSVDDGIDRGGGFGSTGTD